ncbi:MBL fold metallo-hydrolase [Mucilaginibacter kameinonensis]|uniref:MBL fold metallo-hydrolase n=1 Tax=Mucilaginibacter kameinonensis TaxID=452286 RepID=UPI000EF75BA4|nr:MBL fold metallo-hydrolase [Mucilaginibacter kameinonensis]
MNKTIICGTCGTQFLDEPTTPSICPICTDDRQYVPENGQQWTLSAELEHRTIKITQLNEHLYALKIQPDFAIAQRALLLISPEGNILWDCIPYLDKATIDFIRAKGGLKAIAFSHPHYYSNMNDWAAEFECPIYIHQNDAKWVPFDSPYIYLWDGNTTQLWDGISIVHIGGHFAGSCVLHIKGLTPQGMMFCGDTFNIARSKRHMAIMYSYPNIILLSKTEFAKAYQRASQLNFDTVYGAFENQDIEGNAMEIFEASMQRYKDSYGL